MFKLNQRVKYAGLPDDGIQHVITDVQTRNGKEMYQVTSKDGQNSTRYPVYAEELYAEFTEEEQAAVGGDENEGEAAGSDEVVGGLLEESGNVRVSKSGGKRAK